MRASAFFQIRKVDEEKRLVIGRATQEVVDRSGEVMDYETTKPYIEAWSAEQSEATGGKSLGNIRAMHQDIAAGKVVGLDFDDAAKAVDITAKITDDAEWSKVLDGTYAGFSIGGSYVKRWPDPSITVAGGKPATRYTAKLSEISLVDRPCVPSAAFFDIVKADGSTETRAFTAREGTMGEEVKKGLWEAKELITAIQSLKFTHDQIGEGGVGAELEEKIRELGRIAVEYLAEELGEHVGLHVPEDMDLDAMLGLSSETDMETDDDGEPIEAVKGDFPGHPFRGNQSRGGSKGGKHHGASLAAHRASVRAHRTQDASSHRSATNYHRRAAAEHRRAGNERMASYHAGQAKHHSTMAGVLGGASKVEGVEMEKAARTGQKAMRKGIHDGAQELAKMCKAYLDTYVKEDGTVTDDEAEKANHVADLAKAEAPAIDMGEEIRKAVADAMRPYVDTMAKAARAVPASPAPVLRSVAKGDDSEQTSTVIDELAKAAESDPIAAIKLAHRKSAA